MTEAKDGGKYDKYTDSYRFKTPKKWYKDFEKRYNEVDKKVPLRPVKSVARERERRIARNALDDIKVRYMNRKKYYF